MKLLGLVCGVVVLAGLATVFLPENSSAASCPNNRTYCNTSEQVARDACFNDGNYGVARGVIWFNASGNAATDTGYYANTVNIDYDASFVQVNIRGSVFACGTFDANGVYASRVKPGIGAPSSSEQPVTLGPNDHRLTNLSSRSLYRGVMPGDGNLWSSRGTEIQATLDVRGIADDNENGNDVETFNINLYRCFSSDGNNITGQCYSNPVRVRVERERIPSQYDLVPGVSISKTVVELDDSAIVTHQVENEGDDPSAPTIWRLSKMVYDPATTLSSNDMGERPSANDPCGSFRSNGRSVCETVPGQERTDVVFNNGRTVTFNPVYTYVVPNDMPVGTKVCFVSSVSRPTHRATPVWQHSSMQCVVVGKKPKLQVWGGDLRSGGEIDTSVSTINSLGETYGSWGEYGVLSRGNNSGFGSGAGLNNGSSNSAQSSWSNLTFANPDDPPCNFGCYSFTLFSAPLASQFTLPSSPTTITGTQNLNNLASGTYRATAGTLRLSATTIDPGKTIVIISTGNVRIEGDIAYNDGPYSNIRDIPQVIIKAPIIRINPAAGRVDAWLIATGPNESGELNTCWDNGIGNNADLNANICNTPLTINGPVVADTLYLRRTGGSGSLPEQRGEPAEIFNLRADAYLWANAHSSGSSRVQTVYTKELSPRF